MNISHMNRLARTTVIDRPDGSGELTYNGAVVIMWTTNTLYICRPFSTLARRRLTEALTYFNTPWFLQHDRKHKRTCLVRHVKIHRKACVCAVKVPLISHTITVSRNPHGLEL